MEDKKPKCSIEKNENWLELEIPGEITFPLELSKHLKEKLESVMKQNWHLKKHITTQQNEIVQLRKYKELNNESMDLFKNSNSDTLVATKLMEYSKKNRDMTAINEVLKTKVQRLLAENDDLKGKLIKAAAFVNNCKSSPPSCSSSTTSIDNLNIALNESSETDQVSNADTSQVSQQLRQTTNKMMEYRRKNQLLEIELRTALRALAQEVGEGVTPKTILREIGAGSGEPSWRGRQQQILALKQNLSELQIKYDKLTCQTNSESGETKQRKSNLPIPISKRRPNTLEQHEIKKFGQIEKLTHELDDLKTQLKESQLETKGSKARIKFLESQVRSLKVDLDGVNNRLQVKEEELKQTLLDLNAARREVGIMREKETSLKESSQDQIHELNQSLSKERSAVHRLQKLVSEKQEVIQKLDNEVNRLGSDLQVYSDSTNAYDKITKIKALEAQLEKSLMSLREAEKERNDLKEQLDDCRFSIRAERQQHCDSERLFLKAMTILKRYDNCIDACLDESQIVNTKLLEEVECIRSMIRELKVGNQNCLELPVGAGSDDPIKLKLQIAALTREVGILQNHLKKLGFTEGKQRERNSNVK